MKMTAENKHKLLQWQRVALEVANSIGYRMIDDRDLPDIALKDLAGSLEGLLNRVRREISDGEQ